MRDGTADAAADTKADATAAAIPLVAEELHVETRRVDTHTVRVRKRLEADEVEVDVPLATEQVEIERVAVGRVVDGTEPPRREGDVTIVPVYEEVLVKRWLLREELRIRHVQGVAPSQTVRAVLRRETVEVVRTPIAAGASPRPFTAPATATETDPQP